MGKKEKQQKERKIVKELKTDLKKEIKFHKTEIKLSRKQLIKKLNNNDSMEGCSGFMNLIQFNENVLEVLEGVLDKIHSFESQAKTKKLEDKYRKENNNET